MKNHVFVPHPLIANGTLQTTFGNVLQAPMQPSHEVVHHVELNDGDKIALIENKALADHGCAVLLIHGLGSNARNTSLTRMAAKFQKQHHHVFRMHHRGVGDGRGIARGMYHAGRSEDIVAALRFVAARIGGTKKLVAIGASLSANILLRALGKEARQLPSKLCGAIALNPILNAEESVRAMPTVFGGLFDKYYVAKLKGQIRERHRLFPDLPKQPLPFFCTLFQLDDLYTARQIGYTGAAEYYTDTSALPHLKNIQVPTRIIASEDDPIDTFEYKSAFANLAAGSKLHLELLPHGGHLGYLSSQKGMFEDRHWIDEKLIFETEKLSVN